MNIDELLQIPPYGLSKSEKQAILGQHLRELTAHHRDNCTEYQSILKAFEYKLNETNNAESIPFIPVRLFKEYYLRSVPDESISVKMTSSGTTGQKKSVVAIDAETSKNQKKVLAHIVGSYIGNERLPLLILDSRMAVKDKKLFGARGAGILGFSIFGRNIQYALDDEMKLNMEAVNEFLEKHRGTKKLLFGYTFMIWEHFCESLREKGSRLDFERDAMLFHVGGWKKLADRAVDNEIYKKELLEVCNIDEVYNYYGMAEQLGSIFVECECGYMHPSNFSDIIIRNPEDFIVQKNGEKGLIELVSVLPKSYPGHAILTEDEGIVCGEDDCKCGRKGKYFKILGRVKNAELRGCSDTYADRYERI